MEPLALEEIAQGYDREGYVGGIDILSGSEAANHRAILEEMENRHGALHYKAKIHTIMQSPFELATHPRVLDVVEALIGPDILLYNVEYIIKEPKAPAHVSWHQDLTYWGLSHDDQVSLWLALSPASAESGCMRIIPGSHRQGRKDHHVTRDENNVLLQGQTVHGVPEAEAVLCPLNPGQASFHHGWVLHASMPNLSDDRRIGLNAQFLAPHVKQIKHDRDTAMLVRGQDRYGHFGRDLPAQSAFDEAVLHEWNEKNRLYVETAGSQ
ncbi:phytanoyl-CoA dioxygenase family protein [Aestuariispira insulae]|uniref:Phytanoyl-CoA dioxygenase PhyH n=1 Tax=Aestuariispira insulae TaxID=1461337 RepID=A0A3D9H2L3_9PROT|nr:phytanoyl-CoA dioxygenase family protein [Aestuariispira insulae]RED43757.1 phytanoyl-CoA dioxygenase PhyH [Aestuariispira insulae]